MVSANRLVGYTGGQWAVKACLNSAFDEKPPFLGQTHQYGVTGVNTAPEAYDTAGAAWYLQFGWAAQ